MSRFERTPSLSAYNPQDFAAGVPNPALGFLGFLSAYLNDDFVTCGNFKENFSKAYMATGASMVSFAASLLADEIPDVLLFSAISHISYPHPRFSPRAWVSKCFLEALIESADEADTDDPGETAYEVSVDATIMLPKAVYLDGLLEATYAVLATVSEFSLEDFLLDDADYETGEAAGIDYETLRVTAIVNSLKSGFLRAEANRD